MTVPILIHDVSIVDGTGAAAFTGDVLIEGDRITAVRHAGQDGLPQEAAGAERVDGTGLVLSPGFVDVHTHDDAAIIAAPLHECKTLQGVTSIVVGNCGYSPVPSSNEPNAFGSSPYASMADYLADIEAAEPAVNVAALVGHGTIRESVMGRQTQGEASEAQLAEMLDHLTTAFDDGAIGFSSGLAYEPGRYSPASELQAFAAVARNYGAIYTTHMRNEGDHLLESIAECIDVAESQGIPLQISHLKASGPSNWGKAVGALAAIDAARDRGVDVMADQYPYTRGSTMLEQVVRVGALEGPSSLGQITPQQVLISSAPKNPQYEGKTLAQIAAESGIDAKQVADDIVAVDGRSCFVVLDMMSEDDVSTVMAHPAVMVGTDGIPVGGKSHPRLGHTYPRILGRYVREQGLLDLPEAVRGMTSVPAERFGFVDRGVVRAGAFADLVLFDANTVLDTGTWTEPDLVPDGIAGVWVNGERVVDGQTTTGARPGRVVRRSS